MKIACWVFWAFIIQRSLLSPSCVVCMHIGQRTCISSTRPCPSSAPLASSQDIFKHPQVVSNYNARHHINYMRLRPCVGYRIGYIKQGTGYHGTGLSSETVTMLWPSWSHLNTVRRIGKKVTCWNNWSNLASFPVLPLIFFQKVSLLIFCHDFQGGSRDLPWPMLRAPMTLIHVCLIKYITYIC